ncbi:MAG: hypothetical protein Q4G25_16050, partial [Paracoccus sp. (in: a-proteobacteria)]|nr:hypothetical protein [Paracoccus sp. (in: a-proteobacteria)]
MTLRIKTLSAVAALSLGCAAWAQDTQPGTTVVVPQTTTGQAADAAANAARAVTDAATEAAQAAAQAVTDAADDAAAAVSVEPAETTPATTTPRT